MRNTKYVMSGGLAFSEGKDMDKLRRFSLKGWHVRDFTLMGYKLEKGISTDYIYSVDYRSLEENEAEEYFDFFNSAGWSHVTSEGNIHLFRALPGIRPIYSDRETVVEKHDNLGSSMKWFTLSLLFITALVWLGTFISTGLLQTILNIAAVILSVIAVPTLWTVLTIYNNKWRVEGKKGLSKLIKLLPFLFLGIAIIILLVIDDSSNAFLTLAYMIIGAVILPTVIWIIMSLYHRLFGEKV
ncbi:DUF2812 domain-containing protein [Aquibacillus koreensis]|uniref:DUF2812 domain-containing protein n=1 Tax=Aquibacillus koreensis TaxID=279446 RepID=A0A9X4AHA7_9BACI|nr:DUF2812 domain-containing protein [Aquibacillus koreensis]MCT2534875.1 DUF2812 domain-containing protein [Aquibacillus koreensis]MDC3419514.1 DUF2812 domain-containing protein [Aquibacillus koreensis]